MVLAWVKNVLTITYPDTSAYSSFHSSGDTEHSTKVGTAAKWSWIDDFYVVDAYHCGIGNRAEEIVCLNLWHNSS